MRSITLWLTRLPVMPSMKEKMMWPPSKGGMGRRFKIPRLRLITPSQKRASANPRPQLWCSICTIPTGPATHLGDRAPEKSPVSVRQISRNVSSKSWTAKRRNNLLCRSSSTKALSSESAFSFNLKKCYSKSIRRKVLCL